jgi:hypothetical protein
MIAEFTTESYSMDSSTAWEFSSTYKKKSSIRASSTMDEKQENFMLKSLEKSLSDTCKMDYTKEKGV